MRHHPWRFVSFLLVTLASGMASPKALAAAVTVTLRPAPGQSAPACEPPVLLLKPLVELPSPQGEVKKHPVVLGKASTLTLEPGPWEVTMAARSCWAAPKKILVDSSRALAVELSVFRASEAAGVVQVPRGTVLPEKLRLMFSSSFANPKAEEPNADVFCELSKKGRFRCPLPAAQLDLRLSVEGFAPAYWWGKTLPPLKVLDLGPIPLAPGSALAGWLLTEQGEPPGLEAVALSLLPQGLADTISPSDQKQQRFSKVEAKPLANGFFQFQALIAGNYILVASGNTFAEIRLPVELVEGRESRLRDPVLLLPPLTATFSISPPSDPEGSPWRISLKRLHESTTYADDVVNEEVPLDGWYEAKGLNPGQYLIRISNPKGDGVAARMVVVGEEPMPIEIRIGGVRVVGEMTLGNNPLAGTIWFGGKYGAEKVTATAGDDGAFEASLPRAGAWMVEVEAPKPPVKRRFLKVEIAQREDGKPTEVDFELPATRLRGTVRAADGSVPRRPLRVYVVRGRPGGQPSQQVDENGRFEFNGLDEGTVQLHVRALGAMSEVRWAAISKGREEDVLLTLQPEVVFKGLVVGPQGPVPGARVQLDPVENPWVGSRVMACDGGGHVSVELPGGTRELFATVEIPGGLLGVFRVPVREGEDVRIAVPGDGGTLAIELPKEGIEWDGDTTPIFFRDGMPFSARMIEHWAGRHQRQHGRPNFLVAPNLAPGHYEACHVAIEDYGATILGQLARRNCVAGHLSPLGELTLKLPSVKKK